MLRPVALALVVAAPAASAQAFVRAEAPLGPVVQVEAPASFQTLGLMDADGELEGYALAARGGDGALTVVSHELPRPPSVSGDAQGGWVRATVSCGTACFLAWYADPATGRVSTALGSPIHEDEARGWVLLPGADGALVVDPFDPAWAWTLPVDPDSPLGVAVQNLTADVEVTADGMLVLSAEGVPEEIRAPLPERPGETGWNVDVRDYECPVTMDSLDPFGEIQYTITFSPDGGFVSAEPHRSDPVLERAVARLITECRAEPLPPEAPQVDQATIVTFRFE